MNSLCPLSGRKTTPGSRTRSTMDIFTKPMPAPAATKSRSSETVLISWAIRGDVTQTLAGLQEILVKRRMKRSRDPDDRFVCEILVIDFRVGRQGMILRKRGNQLIVPDTAHFEALSIGRQFDDSRLDRSFEKQFDLSRRIGAAQRESRSWHPLGKRGLESDE